MQHKFYRYPLAAALLAMAHPSFAAEGWSGSGELGLALAKGNTDTQTVVGKLALSKEVDKWKHQVGAAFLYGKSDGLESANRYELSGSSAYRLTDRSYVSSNLRSSRDHFAANEYQTTVAVGYGYEAIKSPNTTLIFEVGPGYRWSKLQDLRVHENEPIVRGLADFSHRLSDTASLYNTLLIEAGQDNIWARNDLGLQVKITQALALKAGIEVRHNTDTVPGRKRTDTLTTVNVVYGF